MAKTYNTLTSDVTAGSVLTATLFNQVQTNVRNYRVPPACSVARTATQSINSATDTRIAFTAGAEFDTESPSDPMFSSGSNTRITIQTTGIYIVTANLRWAANSTGVRYCTIWKNGAAVASLGYASPGSVDGDMSSSRVISLADNDYLEMNVYQTSGVALNINWAYLAAAWVGQTS